MSIELMSYLRASTDFQKALSVLPHSKVLSIMKLYASSLMKHKFFAICSWVSTSHNEPLAIPRKCEKSPLEFRPNPSAIFDGTDTTARRN